MLGEGSDEVVKIYVYEKDWLSEISYGVEAIFNCFGR